MVGKLYPIHDELKKIAGVHCTTLVVTQNWAHMPNGLPIAAQPDASLRNGTLTFVRSAGRTYGITCQHVVDHYRSVIKASGAPGSHSMRTMLNGFYIVMDHFVQPKGLLGEKAPDVAIRELHPGLIDRLGKRCIDLDVMPEPPEHIRHGYAVGFPEGLKYNKHDDQPGYRVSMPQVDVLAEIERRPNSRFAMFSELDEPTNPQEYSGMSGGPIYWSTEDDYGIFGIVYEGGPGSFTQSIHIFGEIATPKVIRGWLEDVPLIFPTNIAAGGVPEMKSEG